MQRDSEELAQQETAPSGDGSHSQSGSAENVDRIREILFGHQIREYGQRFAQIEERLSQETAELKAEVRRRLDTLESFTRQEVTALGARLQSERSERTESTSRLSQTLSDSVKSLERSLMESDERTSNGLRELREATFDGIKRVLDDLTEQIGRIEVSENRRIEEVRIQAIDRSALASLLAELAMRIRGELGVPGLGGGDGGPKP